MTVSQQKASNAHPERAKAHGLARVEVQVPSGDAGLIKAVAEVLRGGSEDADNLRKLIAGSLPGLPSQNAFDIFGSDLPDEAFEGVFDQPRSGGWREIEL